MGGGLGRGGYLAIEIWIRIPNSFFELSYVMFYDIEDGFLYSLSGLWHLEEMIATVEHGD